jgi:hypothetical protein
MVHLPCDEWLLIRRVVARTREMVTVIRAKSVDRYAAFVHSALGQDN